ncbi:hypothetical protein C8Q74DRAFT_1390378 [Fomes fomentarius]|nr:hypothetical protein C8Q74DRAFT_1390378 [Fomes fomentarius]
MLKLISRSSRHGRVVARDISTLDEQYFSDLFTVRALSLAGYVILLYEFLAAVPDEVRHYIWPTRWSTVKTIYLANRYGNIVFLALENLQLMGLWRSDSDSFCYHSTLALSLVQLVSFASVHVLVLLRAWATWGRHVKVLAALATMFVVYATVSISMITWGIVSIGDAGYPLSHEVGTCIGYLPRELPSKLHLSAFADIVYSPIRELNSFKTKWIVWFPGLLLECAVFILTMVSLQQFKLHLTLTRHTSLVQVIYRDGIVYFITTLFSNLFNILVWAIYADRALNMLANTFTLCLMVSAGQRLVLDLRKVSNDDRLSTTHIRREVSRAVDALRLSRTRSPSPIVFSDPSCAWASLSSAQGADELRVPVVLDEEGDSETVVELSTLQGGAVHPSREPAHGGRTSDPDQVV